jgi:hypothetical protein
VFEVEKEEKSVREEEIREIPRKIRTIRLAILEERKTFRKEQEEAYIKEEELKDLTKQVRRNK